MEDRWEGAYSEVNVALRPQIYGEHWPAMAPSMQAMYAHSRTHTYLNCWYVGQGESYAMWKLYDAAAKGVAIRTTAGLLQASLVGEHRPEISGARVNYVDYSKTYIPEGNLFLPYIYKRLSFSHEMEYRLLAMWSARVLETDEHQTAIRSEPDLPPQFLREAVDLGVLIDAIYVSPDAPGWVARTVADVASKYLPSVDVRHSDLAADPVS